MVELMLSIYEAPALPMLVTVIVIINTEGEGQRQGAEVVLPRGPV